MPPSPHALLLCLGLRILLLSLPFAGGAAVAEPVYALNVPALQLVTSEPDFTPFARRVAADVDSALRRQPAPDNTRLRLLLGIRVHLALHFGDDDAALAAAERIRALQAEPGERAHAGLTTRALVSSHHDPRAPRRHP